MQWLFVNGALYFTLFLCRVCFLFRPCVVRFLKKCGQAFFLFFVWPPSTFSLRFLFSSTQPFNRYHSIKPLRILFSPPQPGQVCTCKGPVTRAFFGFRCEAPHLIDLRERFVTQKCFVVDLRGAVLRSGGS